MFDGRRLTVNDRLVKPNYVLSPNDTIKFLVHMHEPEVSDDFNLIVVDMKFVMYLYYLYQVLDHPIRLLHVGDDVIVVDKPSSIPVHPIGKFRVSFMIAKTKFNGTPH